MYICQRLTFKIAPVTVYHLCKQLLQICRLLVVVRAFRKPIPIVICRSQGDSGCTSEQAYHRVPTTLQGNLLPHLVVNLGEITKYVHARWLCKGDALCNLQLTNTGSAVARQIKFD